MNQVAYVDINGQIWKLLDDGSMEALAPGETPPPGAKIIGLEDLEATASAGNAAATSGNSLLSNTPSSDAPGSAGSANLYGSIDRAGDEVLASAGFQTVGLPGGTDTAPTLERELVGRLDPDAGISVNINDDDNLTDNFVNRFENPAVDFFGATLNIEDGWTIELTLVDSTGQVFNSDSTSLSGAWELLDQDLSNLAEGPFTITATASDIYGNFVSDSASSIKDTLAEGINLTADTGADDVINLFEAESASLSGEFSEVQAGANVTISITDINGNNLTFNSALDSDGKWQINQDLRSLDEGTLQLRADTIDLAGNPANTESTAELRLSPTISIENIDNDGVFNRAEAPSQNFFGSVFNVENGQSVTLTITDSLGATVVVNTTVVASNWLASNVNVSGLEDGPLQIVAETSNTAGASANAALERDLDQTTELTANFVDPNSDAVYNAVEATDATIRGLAIDVEVGQPVFIVISDGNGWSQTGVSQIGAGQLWSLGNLNLSGATGETLTLLASSMDKAGNPVTATTQIDYDPDATINNIAIDDTDGDQDQLFNAAEVGAGVMLEGTTDDIEAGRPITVTVTDGAGKEITAAATVQADGSWIVDSAVNLSSLDDGNLTVLAEGSDAAGNPASGSDTIHKDVAAAITAQFDQNPYTPANVENATVSGTVTDVEVGRQVQITISDTDGATADINLTGTVNAAGSWVGDSTIDLSTLLDGTLSINVSTTDIAGNPAAANNTALKDAVTVTIHNDDLDGVFNIAEAPLTDFYGETTFVANGGALELTITDSKGKTVVASTTVSGNNWNIDDVNLSGLTDGPLVAVAAVTNSIGDSDSASITRDLDQTIDISADFVDNNSDSVYNALEGKSVKIQGTVTDIENGRDVTLSIQDADGNNIAFVDNLGNSISNVVTIAAGQWSLDGLDLSAAVPGQLTITAASSDAAGNTDSATNTIDYDPNATINNTAFDDTDNDQDQLFNAAEVGAGIMLEGTTSDIESGRTITVTVSDSSGKEVTASATVQADGSWIVDTAVSLSGLDDGDLTVLAEGSDAAGNLASGTDTIHKDVTAAISVQFDGDGKLSLSEITAVTISGSTTDIEPNRDVSVTISGSGAADITFITQVLSDGSFTSNSSYDLSGFDDGTLTVTATATDSAGNSATNNATTIKDVAVEIDIDTGLNGLDVAKIQSGLATIYRGTTDAEENQQVSLTFSDGVQSETITALVKSGGNWETAAVSPGSLNPSLPWTITASVSDQAGNSALDDTPTLDTPQSLIVSEADLAYGPDTAISALKIDIGGNPALNSAPFTFSDASRQVDLASLLSSAPDGTSDTRVEVAADGKTIQLIRNGDNFVTLEASIDDAAKTVTLTLRGGIEQAVGLDVINSSLLVQASQNDIAADPSADVVETALHFAVQDGLSFAENDDYQVVEDTLSQGNLFDNDNKLEGPLEITSIDFGGTNYSVSFASAASINTGKGLLTVQQNGDWSFAATRNQNHSGANPEVTFSYNAIDADGDIDTATTTLEIIDGAAGSAANIDVSSAESNLDTLPGPAQLSGVSGTIVAGSDNLVPSSIAFTPATVLLLNAQGLKSNGDAVTFALTNGNKTLTASADGKTVYVSTLSATQSANGQDLDASAATIWHAPLDHSNADGDVLELQYFIEASDTDGTPVPATTITVEFSDGANPDLAITQAVALDEDNLDSPNPTISATGELSLGIGSDVLVDLVFAETNLQPALTSNGETIIYTLSGDGQTLIGFVTDVSVASNEVFRVELADLVEHSIDSRVDYTVTLSQALDQVNVNGGDDGDVQLPLKVQLTDYDGDPTLVDLDIVVNDAAAATVSNVNLNVSETPKDTSSLLSGSDADIISISAGKDKIVSAEFGITDGAAVTTAGGLALTSNTHAVTWRDNGDGTLDAMANGSKVFTVTLPAAVTLDAGSSLNIPIKLDLLGVIDHLPAVTDLAQIALPLHFIDSDGTRSVATANLSLADGLDPSVTAIKTAGGNIKKIVVQEKDLNDDYDKATKNVVEATKGSDAFSGFDVTMTTKNLYTSDGTKVELVREDNFHWLGTATDGRQVFRLTLDANGRETIELFESILHQRNNGTPTANKTISFKVSAIDADGDVSPTVNLKIRVKDDTPQAPEYDLSNILKMTEGDSVNGNVLTGSYVTKAGDFGEDEGEIDEVRYLGVSYRFDDDGSGAIIGDPVVITLNATTFSGSADYGTLTLSRDGSYTITTGDVSNSFGLAYPDSFDFDMIDQDGDTKLDNTFHFSISDAEGIIKLSPLSTTEDIPAELNLTGSPGDIDNGETITGFIFNSANLQGGTLTLDGIELDKDASGNYILRSDQLVDTGSGIDAEVQPDGVLVFTPFADSSNQTAAVTIDVTMIIATTMPPATHLVDKSFDFSVISDADAPLWDAAANYTIVIDEDTGSNALNPEHATLADTDTSEQLSYRISAIEDGISLSTGGNAVVAGDALTAAQFNALHVTPDDNISGSFTFTAQAIATEQENSDSASSDQIFTVEVAGVADTPEMQVRDVRGSEDVPLDIADIIHGNLTDNDGSERLWYELTLPDGWSITAPTLIHISGSNIYRVSDADLQAGNALLVPKEDLSKVTEISTITVRPVAVDIPQDGVAPDVVDTFGPSKSFTVTLKGVADAPDISPGANGTWSYDSNSKIISANSGFSEDSRIALDFEVGTQDDDGSEIISLHLSGLPEGSSLYNGAGELQYLPVFDASNPLDPIYTVTQAQLADLFFQPPQDYSGAISLKLEQINTEPDGDSAAFDITIDMNIVPTIDTVAGQSLNAQGLEDTAKSLDLMPVLRDIDSSESLTEFTLLSGFSGQLFLDGNPLNVPAAGLDLSSLAAGDLPALLSGGRISYQAPEDQHGDFDISFAYTVTDTNGDAADNSTQTFNGTLTVDVIAQVEQGQATTLDDTRIETAAGVLTSTGGDPIDLTNQVLFFEEDLDGSETLDYILIKMPTPSGWYVDHPEAIHDGLGNWILPAPTTSTGVKEQSLSLFDGITIASEFAFTGAIEVEARVLDGSEGASPDDADIISGFINVDFQDPGSNTIAYNPSTLQTSTADGIEGQTTDLSGHLNSDVRNTSDDSGIDKISFRVEQSDLASAGIAEASLTGADMRIHYAADGTTILAYVFDQATLANLSLAGVDEDLAGSISLPITVIATDPSGDTFTEQQLLDIDLLPVVDNLQSADAQTGNEDQAFRLDLAPLLGDSDTDPAKGVETIESIVFSNFNGGRLADPLNVLTDNGDGTFTLSNPALIGSIFYYPPEHVSGQSSFDAALTIRDTTTGGTTAANDAVAVKNTTLTFELEPVTDPADLQVPILPITGDEDSYIDLSGLSANLIDQDGSETISLQITGVPEGAVLYSGSTQLPNNGTDGGAVSGGSLDGVATYSWTVTDAQLANLTIVPPQDFAGNISLQLEAITNEKGTDDFVTSSESFIVGVNPIADGVQLIDTELSAEGAEGDTINISLGAEILESTNPDEVIELTVTALASSNSSALFDLDRIIADGITGRFNDNGNGSFTATVLTTVASLASFDLVAGELAWGDLNLQVDVASIDNATVVGVNKTDTSASESFNLTVAISAKPDPAILTRDFDGVIGSNGINIPLGLNIDISGVNMAPGETQTLIIQGLPDDFSLNHGSRSGSLWTVDASQAANLELQTSNPSGTDPVGDFSLTLNTQSSLNGETSNGPTQVIAVKIQDAGDSTLEGSTGDDSFTGAGGADVFTWRDGDEGSLLFPSRDTISDFNSGSGTYDSAEGDKMDLSGLLSGMGVSDGITADAVINVREDSGNTLFEIQVDGATNHNQVITLEGVSKSDLVPGGYADDADFLQQLIDNNTLLTQ